MAAFANVAFDVAANESELAQKLPGTEALVVANRIYTEEPATIIREQGTSLKWIAFTTSGFDKAIRNGLPPGVVVTNMAGVRAPAVAEQAFFLMMGLVRKARAVEQAQAAHDWARIPLTSQMDNLARKHLVIVGAGAIAQNAALKAKAFDMPVTGISRSSEPPPHFDRLVPRAQLIEAASEADILLVAAMADDSTQGIISKEVIAAMKPSALIINIARGSLIDEPALVDALRENRIAGAGLDVQSEEPLPKDHPLWSLPNVIITPHLGGAGSPEAGYKHAELFVGNLTRWLAGEKLDKIVIETT